MAKPIGFWGNVKFLIRVCCWELHAHIRFLGGGINRHARQQGVDHQFNVIITIHNIVIVLPTWRSLLFMACLRRTMPRALSAIFFAIFLPGMAESAILFSTFFLRVYRRLVCSIVDTIRGNAKSFPSRTIGAGGPSFPASVLKISEDISGELTAAAGSGGSLKRIVDVGNVTSRNVSLQRAR